MDRVILLKKLRAPLLKSLSDNELRLYLLFLVSPELDLKTIKKSLGQNSSLRQLRASIRKLEKMGLGKMNKGRSRYEFYINSR
ncbi:MAG: hypothetical protein HYV48_04320 [Candidatus Omnitrophica bacterium]|nr:hypothetical protein [Candidatus Omnitrophota bacterium]